MRKKNYIPLIMLISMALFTGCASKQTKVESETIKSEFENAPAWVLDTSSTGVLAGVGSAKMGKAGLSFYRTQALATARDEITRIMSVKVKNMVKNFTQVTGIGDDETVDTVSSNVSKQVASQTLVGSKQKDIWISPSNELYVLVVLDPAAVAEAVKESVATSYKSEKALWQQFQAKKGHEELDNEIEKEFGDYKNL